MRLERRGLAESLEELLPRRWFFGLPLLLLLKLLLRKTAIPPVHVFPISM